MKKNLQKFVSTVILLMTVFCSQTFAQTFNFDDGSAVSSPAAGWTNTGIGTYYRSTSTTALTFIATTSCNGHTKANAGGSNVIFFKPDIAITAISITGTGTGSNRTFSSIATSTTIGGTYSNISGASGSGGIATGGAANCGTIAVTNIGTLAAGTFIRITFSGNINTTTIILTPSCTAPVTKTVSGTAAICSGSSTNVTLAASQSGVTYDLYKDGVSQSNTKLGDGNDLNWPVSAAGTYTIRTTTTGGYCIATMSGSAIITLKVNPGITSVTAPSTSICPAATQMLTANGITGTGAVVNWYTATNGGGTQVGTATNTITVGPGTYYARVTGDCTPPAEAFLTVNALSTPSISAENLAGATYTQGDDANALSVTASGGGTISYQWFRSNDAVNNTAGDDITVGTNSNSYTPSTTATGTFYYYVVVSGCSPSATSSISGAIITNAPTGPTIIDDETGFNGSFGNQAVNTVSASSSFLVNGSNLTGDITVTSPAGFEVSLSSGSGYAGSVSLTQSGGTVSNVTVYVHFTPTSAIPYSGNIQLTSSGATEVDVAVNGTGVIPAISLGSSADMNFSVTGWTASASQSTSVTGTNLTGNITASVGAPFELSTTGSGGWSNSVSYTPSSGSVSGTLFVRYNPSSGSGLNSSTITLSSSGATDQTINVTGKAAPLITLSSGSTTQSVKAGVAIGNIVYTVTGGVVSSSAAPLPTGVGFNSGTYTISGTPGTEASYPAAYNYTVTVVGPAGTANATASGSITVTNPDALNIAYIINTGVSANDQVRPHLALNHTLTNILVANVTTSTDFSAYDLVVLTELPSSGSAGMKALWGINKPLLNMKAYAPQANTWAFTGATGVDVNGSTQLDVINSAHPIFNGVTITAGKINMLSGVGAGEKGIQATTYTGGTKLAYISGSTTNVAINEIAVGTDPSGATTVSGVKNEALQAKYIQIGLADISWNNLTADGFKLIDNAVQYLTHNVITATAGANGTISPAGVSYFNNGDNQTYTITPDANYHIASVTVDGSLVALSNYTFSNITANHTIAVTFAIDTYTLTYTAGPNGTISGTSPQTVNYGASGSTVTAVPNANYHFVSWSDGVLTAARTDANVTADISVTASFAINAVTTTTWQGADGASWSNAGNWDQGVPDGSLNVAITNGSPVLDVDFIIPMSKSLTISGSGGLTVAPGKTLTVTGTANFGGKAVTFRSTTAGYGSLGQITGALQNATNVTVERFVPNTFRRWELLAVPTSGSQTIKAAWQEGCAAIANCKPGYGIQIPGPGGTANGFDAASSGNAGSLLSWNGTGWSNVANTTGAISADANKAYFVFVRGDRTKGIQGTNTNTSATTLETNGSLYTGDQSSSTAAANSFALAGNPYASAVNFTTLTRTGGVADVFYIWDAKLANGTSTGAYQTFSGTNYYASVTGGSYGTAGVSSNTTIESGQAFLIRAGATPGTVVFHENSKISGTNGNLGFRPITPAPLVKMDTRLHSISGTGKPVVDGNAVVFDNKYVAEVDEHDAVKLTNSTENFGVLAGGKSLAVEGRPEVKNEDVIAFKMWNMKQQEYELEFIPSSLHSEGLTATLEDSYLHSSTPVSLEASTTVKFTVDANAASSATDRFRIVFKKTAAAVATEAVQPAFAISPNPAEGGIINLQFINQKEGRYSVRLVNEAGQAVYTTKVAHAGNTGTQVLNLPKAITKGTYRVEIVAPDKSRSTKALFVNGK